MNARNTNPVRYLPWFARDVAWSPGLILAVVAVLAGFVFWRIALHTGNDPRATQLIASQIQLNFWASWLPISALLAIGGVVGSDLSRGYYRSLFSKPIPAWSYYLQRFLIGGVAVVAGPVLLGLSLMIALHGGTGLTGTLLASIVLGYLLVGSAAMLVTIFHPFGWLFVFIANIAQGIMGDVIRSFEQHPENIPGFVTWLHRMLPPFDLINVGRAPLHGGDLAHVLVYGGAMLLGALLLFRWRPLGTGGRS